MFEGMFVGDSDREGMVLFQEELDERDVEIAGIEKLEIVQMFLVEMSQRVETVGQIVGMPPIVDSTDFGDLGVESCDFACWNFVRQFFLGQCELFVDLECCSFEKLERVFVNRAIIDPQK